MKLAVILNLGSNPLTNLAVSSNLNQRILRPGLTNITEGSDLYSEPVTDTTFDDRETKQEVSLCFSNNLWLSNDCRSLKA